MVRSCLRPARSMRDAATIVISTFMACTPTLANAALSIPACSQDADIQHTCSLKGGNSTTWSLALSSPARVQLPGLHCQCPHVTDGAHMRYLAHSKDFSPPGPHLVLGLFVLLGQALWPGHIDCATNLGPHNVCSMRMHLGWSRVYITHSSSLASKWRTGKAGALLALAKTEELK